MASFFYQLQILCFIYQVICCINEIKKDEELYKQIADKLYKAYTSIRVVDYEERLDYVDNVAENSNIEPMSLENELNKEINMLRRNFYTALSRLKFKLRVQSIINQCLTGKYTYSIFISLRESKYAIEELNLESDELNKYRTKRLEEVKGLFSIFNGRLLYSTKIRIDRYGDSYLADIHYFVLPIIFSNDDFEDIKSSIRALISSDFTFFIV